MFLGPLDIELHAVKVLTVGDGAGLIGVAVILIVDEGVAALDVNPTRAEAREEAFDVVCRGTV